MSGIEAAMFGALGRDAEAKTSKAGKTYLRLNVRVGDGDQAQWVSVMTFDQTAIADAIKFVKNVSVYIEGRISLDEWTGQDGAKRHGLSVMSFHCRLAQIGRNKSKSEHDKSASAAPGSAATDLNDHIPF
jgi:single-stranded DNA-binding protein